MESAPSTLALLPWNGGLLAVVLRRLERVLEDVFFASVSVEEI